MSAWIEEVPIVELVDGEAYFVAIWHKCDRGVKHYMFSGRGLNGKAQWTVKPGIAIRAVCNDKMREYLKSSDALTAVRIPSDADTRWKARKKRYF